MRARSPRSITALVATVLMGACSTTAGKATPEPEYTVVRAAEPFEIRDYPELVVVATAMKDGTRGGFGRLFDYISGANEGERRIAMTAPVIQAEKGQKIAMTAPVLQTGASSGAREMIFVLPDSFTIDTAPVPTNPAVSLETIPARRVATVRFNGRMTESAVSEQSAALTAWMEREGLQPIGPAETAGYDAPYTLPSMRRNEVLVPISME